MAFWQSLHTPADKNDLCELCIVRNNDIWCFHGSDFNAFSFASQVNGFICSAHTVFVIFVKSETPHYTQNTYDLLTDHSLKVRHTSFHAKLLCGQQDMMSHSMASVLVIRMQGTGYDVTLYSICFRNIEIINPRLLIFTGPPQNKAFLYFLIFSASKMKYWYFQIQVFFSISLCS